MLQIVLSPAQPVQNWLRFRLQALIVCTIALTRQSILTTRVAAQGLVEYALILTLVAIVVIGSLSILGQKTSAVFEDVNCTLSGGPTHVDHGNGNSNRCDH